VPAAAHPGVTFGGTWFNQSYFVNSFLGGGFTPTVFGATAAYDPTYNEVVLFGGCSFVCPTNATWIFSFESVWTNITGAIGGGIPAMSGQSMIWDPSFNTIVVAGGMNSTGITQNWTWGFYGTYWFPISIFLGEIPVGFYPGVMDAAFAYDDALHEAVLVDGCVTDLCTLNWDGTWILNSTGWYVLGAGPTSGAWNGLYGASMAYDAFDQELVLFGGSSVTNNITNGTYTFNAFGWTNVTGYPSAGFCLFGCIYPAPRVFASMTWDAQLDELVMFGGYNLGGALNDTWYFSGGLWYESDLFSSIGGPLPTYDAAMPENSTGIVPIAVGGFCPAFCFNDTWVLEQRPTTVIYHMVPNPTEPTVTVNISAGLVPGTGSGPFVYYYLYDSGLVNFYGGSGAISTPTTNLTFNRTFDFTTPGTYTVIAWVYDFFGVVGDTEELLVVNSTITAAPFGTPNPTEVGVPTVLSAGASLGVPPYTSYSWYFGDHTTPSTLAGPSHTYTAAGTYDGWVTVTDSLGQSVNSSYSVVVAAHVTASPSVSATPAEAGIAVGLTAGAAHGVGSYTYVWHFGDHTAPSTAAAPSHTYAAAGTYHGWVVVTDGLGATDNASFTVTVNAPVAASPTYAHAPAEAGIAVDFASGASLGVGPYTYLWYLGAGPLSTSATPTYTYATAATYDGWVNVTDALGGYANQTFTVTVDPALSVSAIHASSSSPDTATTISFNVTVAHGIATYTYAWSFGTVGTSALASPSFKFGSAGTYTVTVTVTDSVGASVTKTLTVTVSQAPATFLGLPATEGYALLAAIVLVLAAIVVGAVMMMRRRKRASPPPPLQPANTGTSPPQDTSGTPPASPPSGAS